MFVYFSVCYLPLCLVSSTEDNVIFLCHHLHLLSISRSFIAYCEYYYSSCDVIWMWIKCLIVTLLHKYNNILHHKCYNVVTWTSICNSKYVPQHPIAPRPEVDDRPAYHYQDSLYCSYRWITEQVHRFWKTTVYMCHVIHLLIICDYIYLTAALPLKITASVRRFPYSVITVKAVLYVWCLYCLYNCLICVERTC